MSSRYKINRLIKSIIVALGVILVVLTFNPMEARAESAEKCKIVIGDSRIGSLICTMGLDESYLKLYENVDGAVWDAVFYKDGTWLIMCAQGGGYYKNGAYDRACQRAIKLFNANERCKSCGSIVFINECAFNDLFVGHENGKSAAANYLASDAIYASMIKGCSKVYQFNAGPVDEKGSTSWKYLVTNDKVATYNTNYVSTPYVSVIDFYTYLNNVGYKGAINEYDDSGIHYDIETNLKLLDLINVLN